jgi:hypothetical protein
MKLAGWTLSSRTTDVGTPADVEVSAAGPFAADDAWGDGAGRPQPAAAAARLASKAALVTVPHVAGQVLSKRIIGNSLAGDGPNQTSGSSIRSGLSSLAPRE